jgi:hypothetical protein
MFVKKIGKEYASSLAVLMREAQAWYAGQFRCIDKGTTSGHDFRYLNSCS